MGIWEMGVSVSIKGAKQAAGEFSSEVGKFRQFGMSFWGNEADILEKVKLGAEFPARRAGNVVELFLFQFVQALEPLGNVGHDRNG